LLENVARYRFSDRMKKELEAVVGLRDDGDLEHGHWHIAELLAPEGAMVSGGAKGGASRGPSPP
jgi:hypothetical protein